MPLTPISRPSPVPEARDCSIRRDQPTVILTPLISFRRQPLREFAGDLAKRASTARRRRARRRRRLNLLLRRPQHFERRRPPSRRGRRVPAPSEFRDRNSAPSQQKTPTPKTKTLSDRPEPENDVRARRHRDCFTRRRQQGRGRRSAPNERRRRPCRSFVNNSCRIVCRLVSWRTQSADS